MPTSASTLLGRTLRFFFRHFYHELAWTYDVVALAVSLGHWFTWAEMVLPYVKGPQVLELGYGTGHLLETMSRLAGMHVFGLDESRQMAHLAKRRLVGSGRYPPRVAPRPGPEM